jgi:Flp pilus assembly protein TadB
MTELIGGRDKPDDPDPGSSRSRMSDKARSGDSRKRAQESEKRARRRSKRELSIGFIVFAWIVLFVIWFAAGSLLIAAIVFAVLLFAGLAALSTS